MKRALLLAVLVANLIHSSIASAQEARTEWVPLAKSLTVLLNEGWRIISHVQSRTDQTHDQYSFVLAKENKVVICLINNPQVNNAISRCRALN